ncbi:pimeloyl-ACP methyl ester carboxylesterase [Jatrophihabitans sp. GAS493]|uniref:alpha/beta fold hydrolase n=1 Tax=Jatrophihabitans sp. GAS493 TaxID=1907575 RepID=UPI000BB7DAD4|nr:alpha/beta hydrolase [Jatrophihabitans sp. GAS493]SOD73174.1 pimeloyl-ACP methyl ester carboxylesterase [Jatrophihabitans sp. GAS493]
MVNPQRLVPSLRTRSGQPRSVRIAQLSDEPLPTFDSSIPTWPGRKIQLGGSALFVRSTPVSAQPSGAAVEAEPALFVHGLGGSSTNWTDLAAQLSPWLDIEAIDLPGFGRSGPARDDNYSTQSFANLVIAYLEQSNRGPVHLFGNSMGGLISIVVAAARPDLVRTLTLVSPAVPDLRPGRVRVNPLPLLLVPGFGTLALRKLAQTSPKTRARQTVELVFGDPAKVTSNRMAEAIAEVQERGGMSWASSAMLSSLRGMVGYYLVAGARGAWARMASISVPTLVVWGDRDKLVDVGLAPRVATTIPDARLLILPGVGHVAQMEDPQSTARAFLQMRSETIAQSGQTSGRHATANQPRPPAEQL